VQYETSLSLGGGACAMKVMVAGTIPHYQAVLTGTAKKVLLSGLPYT
jgi:hypothetical protein